MVINLVDVGHLPETEISLVYSQRNMETYGFSEEPARMTDLFPCDIFRVFFSDHRF